MFISKKHRVKKSNPRYSRKKAKHIRRKSRKKKTKKGKGKGKQRKLQSAGYMLNDDTIGYFKDQLKTHIELYLKDFYIYIENPNYIYDLRPPPLPPLPPTYKGSPPPLPPLPPDAQSHGAKIKLFAILKSLKYKSLYTFLICTYLGNNINKKPYIRFAALIFISFLLELELFIIYAIDGYNYKTDEAQIFTNNVKCKNIWVDKETSKYRIYKMLKDKTPIAILETFCKELDELYLNIMDAFIEKLSIIVGAINDIVRNLIVKTPSIPHNYDSIHDDWITRLMDKYNNINKYYICDLIKQIISTFSINGYNAEGFGFFSFIYLDLPIEKNKYFGACITWSMIELYIMNRLHIKEENINLVLEYENSSPKKLNKLKTELWIYTHKSLFKAEKQEQHLFVSHWSTEFYTSSAKSNKMYTEQYEDELSFGKNEDITILNSDDPTFDPGWLKGMLPDGTVGMLPINHINVDNIDLIRFRYMTFNTEDTKVKVAKKLNFKIDKKNIFRALLYPILDSYKLFFSKCEINSKTIVEIKIYIEDRYQFFEEKLTEELYCI